MTVITCRRKSSAFGLGIIWLLISAVFVARATRRARSSMVSPPASSRCTGTPCSQPASQDQPNQAGMKCTPLFALAALVISMAAASEPTPTRWGSIALGGNGFGATRGRASEEVAVSGAMRQCEESGGAGECRIRLSYRNQCAAYATGGNRKVGIAYAAGLAMAGKFALRRCAETARHCQIQYAACSIPSSFN